MTKQISILLLISMVFTTSVAAAHVGQWDRFTASVTNAKKYADPYHDVTLNVTWTRPDGSTASFFGFYDGGTTWRLRMMPDQLGNLDL